MNVIDFDDILHQQPFRPFRLRLSLNITIEIRHPEMAVLESSTVVVRLPDSEDEMVVNLSHIVTIEYLPRKR